VTPTVGMLLDRAGQEFPLAELASLWPLGGWTSVTPVTGGKNEHLRVTAGNGIHYLRRSYRSKPREELTRQLHLMRLLRDRGFPAPEVVPACSGENHVHLAGRLWIATRAVEGTPFDDESPAHVRALGQTLARYHQIVADLPAVVIEPAVLTELRSRSKEEGVDPSLRARTAHLVERLTCLLPGLPRVVVHGGARRGSLVFNGDQVAGVLDFDSSHPDVRVLDLAVAVHDVSKVYTSQGQEDHKVALNLNRVTDLLAAYSREVRPTAAEVEALPLLLEAKRLKRGLGRRSRVRRGEALSDNDHAKIRLEDQRLAWLDGHRDTLLAACNNALARVPASSQAHPREIR
jgi:homoserine kinase type II